MSNPGKIDIPESAQLIHSQHVDVRWGDMDAFRHVNSMVYFQYFEQARAGWFRDQQIADYLSGQSEAGPVVANAHCDYRRPIVYPADITVDLYAGERGRRSFHTWYRVRDTRQPDQLYATGHCAIVWIDYATGKAISIYDNVIIQLPEARK